MSSGKNFLDLSVMSLLSLTPFYKDGWGDPGILVEARKFFANPRPSPTIQVRWVNNSTKQKDAIVDEGYFESPVNLPMPPVTRTAWFLRRLPKQNASRALPVVVLLAATGDENYAYRSRLSKYLLKQGIGVVILVNPFYGKRRPPGQFRSSIRSFSDQLLMNYMTIEEARGLLKWLSKEHPVVGVAGYSMGGFMSAYTAALYEEPIACVPAASGLSAGVTFTQAGMKTVPSWNSLRLKDVDLDPQELFTRSLAPLSLDELPRPKDPESTIIVGNRHDAIVPPEQVQALYDYWNPRELRWLDAGHSTGYLLYMKEIAEAIGDAVAIRLYKEKNNL